MQKPSILTYHGIIAGKSDVPVERELGAELYDVRADMFHQQMTWLVQHDHKVIDLEHSGSGFDSNKVILTFDDGEMNNFTRAWPVLKEFGFPATFFIVAGRVGQPGYMDWPQIKQLADEGMVIGSHGFSHKILTELTIFEVEYELKNSKNILEQHLGRPVVRFSVPRGFYNEDILRLAWEAGYKYIFVSEKNAPLPSSCAERLAVMRHWSIKHFEGYMLGEAPLSEDIKYGIKMLLKAALGEEGYNKFRDGILRRNRRKA